MNRQDILYKVFPNAVTKSEYKDSEAEKIWKQHVIELAKQKSAYYELRDKNKFKDKYGRWVVVVAGKVVSFYTTKNEAFKDGINACVKANKNVAFVTRVGYEAEVELGP